MPLFEVKPFEQDRIVFTLPVGRLGHVDARTTMGYTHLVTADDVRIAQGSSGQGIPCPRFAQVHSKCRNGLRVCLGSRSESVKSWLRGVDLNHRPLGYESFNERIFNELADTDGICKSLKRRVRNRYWTGKWPCAHLSKWGKEQGTDIAFLAVLDLQNELAPEATHKALLPPGMTCQLP